MNLIRITIALFAVLSTTLLGGEPLKVYILVGQSNMQGTAHISTARHMAADPKTKALHDKLVEDAGKPRVYDNIRIAGFSQARGNKDTEKSGPLTFGYGADLSRDEVCGPELAFGITMHEIVKEPILIIKTSWGGKSLYNDFRPPSADAFEGAKNPKSTGHYYRLMANHVKKVLADPGKYHPAYKKDDGYEIAGFVWFQGWNDMVNMGVYKNRYQPGGYDDYSKVLTMFINDVRREFKASKMPFVIGVLGVDGPTKLYASPMKRYKEMHQYYRDAMAAPAKRPEFKNNVKAVLTEDFWPHDVAAAETKAKEIGREAKEALKKEQKTKTKLKGRSAWQWEQDLAGKLREKKMTEKERLALTGMSNAQFHYFGCLKFFAQAGEAFAKAVAE